MDKSINPARPYPRNRADEVLGEQDLSNNIKDGESYGEVNQYT